MLSFKKVFGIVSGKQVSQESEMLIIADIQYLSTSAHATVLTTYQILDS